MTILYVLCQKLQWNADPPPPPELVLERVDELLGLFGLADQVSMRALWDRATGDFAGQRADLWAAVQTLLTVVHTACSPAVIMP